MQVYAITNDVNDKAYVGACSMPLKRRWSMHLYDAKFRPGRSSLYADMRQYGSDKFHIVRVWSGYVSRVNLFALERYYISSFQTMTPNGYNQAYGHIGKMHTEDTKERIGAASRITRAKDGLRPSFLGRHHSEDTKQKIRTAKTGVTHSDETKEKRRVSITAWWAARKNKPC